MALGKISFTSKRTLHVIETNYIFFPSLSHLIFFFLALSNLFCPLAGASGRTRAGGSAWRSSSLGEEPAPAAAVRGGGAGGGCARGRARPSERSPRQRRLRVRPSSPRGEAVPSMSACGEARGGLAR